MFAIEKEDEFEYRLERALENRYKNLYLQSYERKKIIIDKRFRNVG